MSDRSESEVEAALEEAMTLGLLQESESETYCFDHVLTRETLYAGLSGRKRRGLHRTAGTACAGPPEQDRSRRSAEIAGHFLEGDERP